MIKFLVYLSMVPVAFFMLISLAVAFGPRRHERSAEMNASDKKVAGLLFVYLVGAFAWTQYAGARDARIAEARAAAEQEYNTLVAERCGALERRREETLLARENYNSLSGGQQARMARDFGADRDWAERQTDNAYNAVLECKRGVNKERAALFERYGVSAED
ncbi:MAG: hypothetical protein NVV74_07680 [Magnetospirillum sp.]|nr:hypothetical protein [Magnetospirillum sp.]